MAEPLPSNMTVDEFLAWAEGRPGRHELELGRVIAMSPQTIGHVRGKQAAFDALSNAVSRAGLNCEALTDGATVRIDATTAYEPDALVYCGPPLPPEAIEVSDPVIVIEVVSPTSVHRDHNQKLVGYFMVPSVRHYLIVNPERRTIVHHAREDEAIRTRILGSGDLHLDPPGLKVKIEDLFESGGVQRN